MNLSAKEQEARKRVCLPLDVDTLEEAEKLVKELSPVVGLFKIGKQLFTNFGPDAVKMVQKHGADVFLDLKYHDIPNTVKGAAKAATKLGVTMFNVHASGGKAMMKAAVEGAKEAEKQYGVKAPKILGVTVLTSLDQAAMNNEIGIPGKVEDEVLKLAKLAQEAGLNGIVCSAADMKYIKTKLPKEFMFVTPGVQSPTGAVGADQKRVFTPGNAIEDGSTILVVGRAITGAPDKVKAAKEILEDMAKRL